MKLFFNHNFQPFQNFFLPAFSLQKISLQPILRTPRKSQYGPRVVQRVPSTGPPSFREAGVPFRRKANCDIGPRERPALRKLYFHSNWMGYDRGDSFPFDFEPNGIPFGSTSKGKLTPRSYPIKFERKLKCSFLSALQEVFTPKTPRCFGNAVNWFLAKAVWPFFVNVPLQMWQCTRFPITSRNKPFSAHIFFQCRSGKQRRSGSFERRKSRHQGGPIEDPRTSQHYLIERFKGGP